MAACVAPPHSSLRLLAHVAPLPGGGAQKVRLETHEAGGRHHMWSSGGGGVAASSSSWAVWIQPVRLAQRHQLLLLLRFGVMRPITS